MGGGASAARDAVARLRSDMSPPSLGPYAAVLRSRAGRIATHFTPRRSIFGRQIVLRQCPERLAPLPLRDENPWARIDAGEAWCVRARATVWRGPVGPLIAAAS